MCITRRCGFESEYSLRYFRALAPVPGIRLEEDLVFAVDVPVKGGLTHIQQIGERGDYYRFETARGQDFAGSLKDLPDRGFGAKF